MQTTNILVKKIQQSIRSPRDWHRADLIEDSLKPLDVIEALMFEGFQVGPHSVPMMPKDTNLSDRCTPNRCSFSRPW